MSTDLNYRIREWAPPPRPEWVKRINEEGAFLDLKGVVPLDENSLIEHAKRNTGLSDFGADDWYEPFQVFIKSLDEEADLSLMGRLMTRSDILMHLEARLKIEDAYKKHPEIADEQINNPIFILGSGRSGTSAIQNLLSCDPDNATPKHWEALLPAPPPEAATYETDPRIDIADKRMTQWNRVTPEIESMHEFNGRMPTELIQIETISFQSFAWLGLYGYCPSYIAYMHGKSALPAFHYAKRVLKLLQWKNPRKRWLIKSPDALRFLPDLFQVFPDLRLLWMHRDPIKAVSSMVSLVGTLSWIRSDKVLGEDTLAQVTNPANLAATLHQAIDWIEQGVIPAKQIANVQYLDFIDDPLATIEGLYKHLDIELTPTALAAMRHYLDEHPREQRPAHRYNTGKAELYGEERELFARYENYFGVHREN
ncbi:MAG: sulfotransferase [Porticoccaceae bacterium]